MHVSFLGSIGRWPVAFGILPNACWQVERVNAVGSRQAAANYRLAACGPRSKERHQSVGEFRQLIPLHRAFAFFTTQMRLGQQFAQICIASAIFYQHRQNAAVFHGQFGADDWPDAVLTRGDRKSLCAVDTVAIEQCDRRHFQFRCDLG